jgi:hypothetical protein
LQSLKHRFLVPLDKEIHVRNIDPLLLAVLVTAWVPNGWQVTVPYQCSNGIFRPAKVNTGLF